MDLRFIFANLVYIIAIAGLSIIITEEKKTISSFPHVKQIIEEYRTKDKLYGILRTKGYSLGQGIDIVEAIVRKIERTGTAVGPYHGRDRPGIRILS